MGNDVALTAGERQALVDPFSPTRGHGLHWQSTQSERSLDFASIVRILREHRWLILGAVGAGLVFAVLVTLDDQAALSGGRHA